MLLNCECKHELSGIRKKSFDQFLRIYQVIRQTHSFSVALMIFDWFEFFFRYVRIPFEIKTPNFFITIHDKLATLRIDGRDMSVKFPEQFNIALNGKNTLQVFFHL